MPIPSALIDSSVAFSTSWSLTSLPSSFSSKMWLLRSARERKRSSMVLVKYGSSTSERRGSSVRGMGL